MPPSELARFSVPSICFYISRPSRPNAEDETTAGMCSIYISLAPHEALDEELRIGAEPREAHLCRLQGV